MFATGRARLGTLLIWRALACVTARANKMGEVTRSVRSGQALPASVEPERMLVVRPKALPLRFSSGVALSDLQRTPESVSAAKQLNRGHPKLAEPYNNLAVIYAVRGNHVAVRMRLKAALVAARSFALAHLTWTKCSYSRFARLSRAWLRWSQQIHCQQNA